MLTKDYIHDALKTESNDWDGISERLSWKSNQRMLHATFGLVTEASELADAMKKHIFYGKPLDTINVEEEVGDLFWYLAIMLDELGVDAEVVMRRNIDKLKARYGHKFSEEKALFRDLSTEREILEDGR